MSTQNRREIGKIKLGLKKAFRNKRIGVVRLEIKACLILDDRLVYIEWNSKGLFQHRADGSFIDTMTVKNEPFDLTPIDSNRVAVTYPFTNHFQIIDISVKEFQDIEFQKFCYGIKWYKERLYICVDGGGILVATFNGEIENKIPVDIQISTRLDIEEDKIYYARTNINTIYCCDFSGNQLWIFSDEHYRMPLGIRLNGKGCLYITWYESNNVMVLSCDGKEHKELKGKTDGIEHPRCLYYDKQRDLLLVCNDFSDESLLFNVL